MFKKSNLYLPVIIYTNFLSSILICSNGMEMTAGKARAQDLHKSLYTCTPIIYVTPPPPKMVENNSFQGKSPKSLTSQMILPDWPKYSFLASTLFHLHPYKMGSPTVGQSPSPKHAKHFHASEPSHTFALPSPPLQTF